MLKHEWAIHVVSFIQNMFIMACFTFLAVKFDKWWLVLISVVFIAMVKYDAEYRIATIDKDSFEESLEDDED